MSYIKRELLLADIMDSKIACVRKDSQIALATFERMVKQQPSADVVEVVHAYWKEITHITISSNFREIHSKLYNCSNCDAQNGRKKSSYCHWCGAKMDG